MSTQTDLVVAVDGSTRVGIENFLSLLNISRELVYGLNINAGSQIGALTFSDQAYIQFQLNTFSDQLDILNGLSMAYQSVYFSHVSFGLKHHNASTAKHSVSSSICWLICLCVSPASLQLPSDLRSRVHMLQSLLV